MNRTDEVREAAANLLEDAISRGYPTPARKVDQCGHGKFGWEDCIACYDEVLTATVDVIRALDTRATQPDAALREALEPFARMADEIDRVADSQGWSRESISRRVNYDDCVRARAALDTGAGRVEA